jgi:Tfp pilus assembly PilM family ATPase
MQRSLLFKLFPPPAFMIMPYVGLDISDDAIRCIGYKRTFNGLQIQKYAYKELPDGLIDSGEIKDEKEFTKILTAFAKSNNIYYAKVSLPEEKTYFFQTEVPSTDFKSIAQNIEFKLDQNVPLSAPDALIQFDLVPSVVTGGALRASVSVVPRVYSEHQVDLLHQSGIVPVAFEVVPKAIVNSYISKNLNGTHLIVHVMKRKTGLYIVSEGVICFTSTIPFGSFILDEEHSKVVSMISKEIEKIRLYWSTRPDVHASISEIIVTGSRAAEYEEMIHQIDGEALPHSFLANVWQNAFNTNTYIPPISQKDSLEYVVAAGLALP